MAKENLDTSLSLIFHHEQGFVNNPNDPGGPTNWGVTQATLSAVIGRKATVADVRSLTRDAAHKILVELYAAPIRFNDLPAGLDHAVLDYAVNSGPARAVKELQKLLEVAPDGIMGLKTLRAAQARNDVEGLIYEYISARLEFLEKLKTWPKFGRGWTRRVLGKDPLGKYPDQLGVVGEAKALARGKRPLGIDPAPEVAQAKGREIDLKATATPQSKLQIGTVAGIVAGLAAEILAKLTPFEGTIDEIKYVILGLTVLGAVAGAVVTINNMRESGAHA